MAGGREPSGRSTEKSEKSLAMLKKCSRLRAETITTMISISKNESHTVQKLLSRLCLTELPWSVFCCSALELVKANPRVRFASGLRPQSVATLKSNQPMGEQ